MKTCKTCMYGILKTLNDGTVKMFCRGEGDGVGDSHTCIEWSDKQCTMCKYENNDVLDEICNACDIYSYKPQYITK